MCNNKSYINNNNTQINTENKYKLNTFFFKGSN